jgi:mannose-6-phosphate isomerase
LGKTEAWYVLEAEPQGEIALGFRNSLSQEKLREAAKSGEIESMLRWYPVTAGNVFYVPAGTVHAIGAGVTLCEIQENSDITYRLFDFGRGRDLHLDHAVHVSRLGPYERHASPVPLAGWRDELLACQYFRIERLKPQSSIRFERGLSHYLILMSVKGSGTIAERDFKAGQAWLVPAGNDEIDVHGPDSEWVLAYSANEAITGLHT